MKNTLSAWLAMAALTALDAAQAQPRIAVTDLAYTHEVAQYFEVAKLAPPSIRKNALWTCWPDGSLGPAARMVVSCLYAAL